MTVAMRAAQRGDGPKVLRLGVLRGGVIERELIVREQGRVTVGAHETNTIVVAAHGVSDTSTLLEHRDGEWWLRLRGDERGRVADASGVAALDDLLRGPRATRTRSGWRIRIDVHTRGKIEIGDTALLFQFVEAPPPPVKVQLPAALRDPWMRRTDWTYNAILAGFVMFAMAGLGYAEYGYDPEVEDTLSDARMVTLIAPSRAAEPEPQPPPAASTPAPPDTSATAANDPPSPSRPNTAAANTPRPASPSAARPGARDADAALAALRASDAVLRGLANSRDFAEITGVLDHGRSAADRLAQGGFMVGSLDSLRNVSTIATAQNTGITRTGLRASADLGNAGFGPRRLDPGSSNISTGPVAPEVILRTIVHPLAPEPTSSPMCSAERAAAVLRARLSGIRWCYERVVRTTPGISGRLELDVTVDSSGHVSDADASGFNAEVAQCVEQRVRTFPFPAAPQTCTYSFPFNFDVAQ